MSKFEVRCGHPGCVEPVAYKIAAVWRDGRVRELKCYGLACRDHLGETFREASEKQRTCSKITGEVIEEVGIYDYVPGERDSRLERLWNLERSCLR